MPDISDIKPTAVGCFLASSLVGFEQHKTKEVRGGLTVVVRLIDKARSEYLMARDAVIDEEKEGKLTYDEIMKRNKGQYLYTCMIINHLENCLNALSRIYKTLKLLPKEFNFSQQKRIVSIRNAIEHIDERISQAAKGSLSLDISEDAFVVEITNKTIKLDDLAHEIRVLHKEILQAI